VALRLRYFKRGAAHYPQLLACRALSNRHLYSRSLSRCPTETGITDPGYSKIPEAERESHLNQRFYWGDCEGN
jgi:hypothetical protein